MTLPQIPDLLPSQPRPQASTTTRPRPPRRARRAGPGDRPAPSASALFRLTRHLKKGEQLQAAVLNCAPGPVTRRRASRARTAPRFWAVFTPATFRLFAWKTSARSSVPAPERLNPERLNRSRKTRADANAAAPLLPLFTHLYGSGDLHGKLIVDLFAGGGGVSKGIEMALGRSPEIAINHDPEAVAMHEQNHAYTTHYIENVFAVDPRAATNGVPVGCLWLSPDCKHFSAAAGGRPLDHNIRSLAWVGMKWAGTVRPDVIILENVPAFQDWGPLIAQRGFLTAEGKKLERKHVPWPNKPRRAPLQRRRWTKGMPNQNPPRGPVLLGADGRPQMTADKRTGVKGRIFKRFVRQLRELGYEVEVGVLKAHEYGAPTIRKRFFLIARCDGHPIHWPEATHGEGGGLLPFRTAAECIQWEVPTRTIFEKHATRNVDLKTNTLRRIAQGIYKYVLQARQPFLVTCNHQGDGFRGQGLGEPMKTLTAARDAHGLITPYMVQTAHGGHHHRQRSIQDPVGTLTSSDRPSLCTPYLVPRYGERDGQTPRTGSVDRPLPTVTTGANGAQMGAAFITKYRQNSVGSAMTSPVDTICAGGDSHHPGGASIYGVVNTRLYRQDRQQHRAINDRRRPAGSAVAGSIIRIDMKTWGGDGALPLDQPMRTIMTKNGYALSQVLLRPLDARPGGSVVTAGHLLRQFGSNDARSLQDPLGSLTTSVKDGLITSACSPSLPDDLPAEMLTGARRVYALMQRYCPEALDLVPEEDRVAELITVVIEGVRHVVHDVGMRMLTSRELFRAMSFPEDYIIDFTIAGRPLPQASQVRMCGNSVPPRLAAAVVGAQFPRDRVPQVEVGAAAD